MRDPFVTQSLATKSHDLGIGLTIARTIVDALVAETPFLLGSAIWP